MMSCSMSYRQSIIGARHTQNLELLDILTALLTREFKVTLY